METYSQRDMEEAGININFVQDNQSMSTKGVLRGLHFQKHLTKLRFCTRQPIKIKKRCAKRITFSKRKYTSKIS